MFSGGLSFINAEISSSLEAEYSFLSFNVINLLLCLEFYILTRSGRFIPDLVVDSVIK